MDKTIQEIKGDTRIESVSFIDREKAENPGNMFKEGITEFYLKPDMVIVENGLGSGKVNLAPLIEAKDEGQINHVGVDHRTGLPAANVRFSVLHNDIHSCFYAAGSCAFYPSFFHKLRVRTPDIKYNIEAGFFAAMSMLDKRIEFRYIPLTNLKIGKKQYYFVGERGQPFTEVMYHGDVSSGKYVAFYVYRDEVVGFVTCGYQNLHLYIWEAMKALVMPSATVLRTHGTNVDHIVSSVLRMRHDV